MYYTNTTWLEEKYDTLFSQSTRYRAIYYETTKKKKEKKERKKKRKEKKKRNETKQNTFPGITHIVVVSLQLTVTLKMIL